MKIWITRETAFSLNCGGLSRCHVWFRKPEYVLIKLSEKERDLPFGDIYESEIPLYRYGGWHILNEHPDLNKTFVFSKLFGYGDSENPEIAELAQYVWKKVCEHFKDKPFEDWDEMERTKELHVKDFLLEVDLSVSLKLLS